VLALFWVTTETAALYPAAVVALGVFGVLVELYNYRAGTDYLRLNL
jgi:hypothetical protein